MPLRAVVERVVHDLGNRAADADQLAAREAVYQTLRNTYPCETDDDE